MINYIRNLIYNKDVTIDCDIINNFEEKIQVFKTVKSYANKFIKLFDEPYTSHLFFKQILRKYEFDNSETKINLKLVISMDKKRTLKLELLTSDIYNSNYEECITIQITNNCRIKSFSSAKHDLDLISTMFSMLLAEYDRIYEISLSRKRAYSSIKYSGYKQECV